MAQGALTKRIIPVHVLTSSYRIAGSVKVSNSGLSGLLTDSTSEFMTIMDASLARIHDPDFLVQKLTDIRLVKNKIHSVSVKRRQDIGPKGITRAGYEHVNSFNISITDSTYEYEGCLEWPGRFDFKALMSGGSWEYLPVFDGIVRSIVYPDLEIRSEAMLINRIHIATFSHTLKKADDDSSLPGFPLGLT
ncbi:MAG: hypothetical protein HQ574_08870 [Chloroflexi bacterium]|nr:hypothetical protein [Chloroflexota bacterium]